MNEDGDELVERMHREAAERYWREEEEGRALVDQVHREALRQLREEEARGDQLVDEAHREAAERYRRNLPPAPDPPTIRYSKVQAAPADSPTYQEWKIYRRELPRLLANGLEGKFALIEGEEIIGIFPTLDEGVQAGRKRYLMQPFLVQPIREWEPILRVRQYYLPRHSIVPPSRSHT